MSEEELTHETVWGTSEPEQVMMAFFDAMTRSKEGNDAAFDTAMECLVLLVDRNTSTGLALPERLRSFWTKVAEVLNPRALDVGVFVRITLYRAEGGGEDDWFRLCHRRSSIQLIIDEPELATAAAGIEKEDLDELDHELRRVGDYGAVPERFLPHGIPANHWWWWYPAAPPTDWPAR